MESSVWRPRARIVAIADLVFSIIGLIGWTALLALTSYALATTPSKKSVTNFGQDGNETTDSLGGILLTTTLVISLVSMLVAVINIAAALTLKNSTEVDRDPTEAGKMARICRIVFVILLIISCIPTVIFAIYILPVISLIVRIIFLYIVHQYIKDLDQTASNPLRIPGVNF